MNKERINICKSHFVDFRDDNIYKNYSFLKVLPILFQEIGKGSYGIVYRAREKGITSKYRAIKKINKRNIKN